MQKLLFFLVSIFVLGCNSGNQDKLVSVWKLSGIEDHKISNTPYSVITGSTLEMKDFVKKYYEFSFVNFCSDTGCIIREGADFIQASWKINESRNTIIARYKDSCIKNSMHEVIIKAIADSVLVLKFRPDTNIISYYRKNNESDDGFSDYINHNEFLLFFNMYHILYNDEKDNIFNLKNNAWRIKPKKPETRDHIKERLKGSINFSIIFISDADFRGEIKLNKYALVAPIRLYGNGVEIIEKENVSQEWISAFYNREQAMQAYQMIRDAFRRGITYNEKDNWVLTDIDLLTQIYEKIQ